MATPAPDVVRSGQIHLRVWCTVEGKFLSTTAREGDDLDLVQCPNNAADPIDTARTTVVKIDNITEEITVMFVKEGSAAGSAYSLEAVPGSFPTSPNFVLPWDALVSSVSVTNSNAAGTFDAVVQVGGGPWSDKSVIPVTVGGQATAVNLTDAVSAGDQVRCRVRNFGGGGPSDTAMFVTFRRTA